MLASGRKITPPGGQGVTIRSAIADAILREEFIPVSGADEAQRAVSDLLAAGVDVIKIVADDNTHVLDRDEITAVVRAAHRARVRVAAHAESAAGIQAAIDGGVDSIEHGNEATDAMLTTMREKGIALVLTAYTIEALRDIYLSGSAMSDAERGVTEKQMTAFINDYTGVVQRATKAGVKVAAGSDMWMRYPGKTRGQATKMMVRALVHAGMSPAAVIRAATADAADVLGWSDRIGSLESGRFADIIAVQGDPLADIAALDAVTFVMKGGRVVTPPSR
jgi:imidazolonepropionase-like amidohydrolase